MVKTLIPVVLPLFLALFACAAREAPPPAVRQSLTGPPLYIAGEYGDFAISGEMDRGCMVGFGKMSLRARNKKTPGGEFSCRGEIDAPPLDKGRVRGMLECDFGRRFAFSMRNLGPDQGIGISREKPEGDLLLFFYHSAQSEAERRFPEIKAEMEEIRSARGQ
ncbi:MAG: hypothetical protein LBU06_03755 [Desulfovibrio sp.]|jgi:hypothetical protein|nr:hypothetical protein [Desulfovibrio sp.]